MKTKLIIGFLALTLGIHAQWLGGTGTPIYNDATTDNVGIGTSGPAYQLHVTQTNTNRAHAVFIDASTNYTVGGAAAGAIIYAAQITSTAAITGVHAEATGGGGAASIATGVRGTALSADILYGVYGEIGASGGSAANVGVYGKVNNSNGNINAGVVGDDGGVAAVDAGYFIGQVRAVSNNPANGINNGVLGTADQAGSDNYGVHGAIGSSPSSGENAGVYGEGSASATGAINAGVMGKINSVGATIDAGVYGYDGGFGTGYYAGYFDGDLYVDGVPYTTNASWTTSDKRFKKNIMPLENVKEKLARINGYTYEYRTDEFKKKNFAKEQQIGLIAQEIQEIFPQLVKEGRDGYNYVNYDGMIPVLLEAIKDLQRQLDELKTSGFKPQNEMTAGLTDVIEGNVGSIEQNIPNPFTRETTINFTLAQTVKTANLAVYDLSGKQITVIQINDRNRSSIVLTSENLSAGMYIYSIIADGKMVDSKRMVIVEK